MPRAKELYRRGQYWLAWDCKRDGTRRTPYLTIFWYDPEHKRERSLSSRTSDLEAAQLVLDAHYLKHERGQAVCPTCGQGLKSKSGFLLADAIADYKIAVADHRSSASAIRARLVHLVNYIASLPNVNVRADDIDEDWVAGFRTWAASMPVAATGKPRSTGTIEASVRALSAVINTAFERGDVSKPARFKAKPPSEVSNTPHHRSDVAELSRMFAYVLDKSRRKRCAPLHQFLIASVATLARPDAVLDISTAPARKQWHSDRKVLHLNPEGRAQTKKFRCQVFCENSLMAGSLYGARV